MDPSTFIHSAAYGDESQARRALEQDPSLASARDGAGVSVITSTVYASRIQFARELARYRDDLDFFEAACIGDAARVRDHLARNPDVVDHHAPDGFTALCLAAYFGHLDLLELLLKAGADLEGPAANRMAVRPLHSAVAHSDAQRATSLARVLLEAGADPNAPQQGGATPLHEAVHRDHAELIRLLIRHGGNPHVSNDDGDSALQLAHAEGKKHLVEVIEKTFVCR